MMTTRTRSDEISGVLEYAGPQESLIQGKVYLSFAGLHIVV